MLDIFKYSHLNVGTELNVITLRTDSKLFTGNISGGILRTTMSVDSTGKNDFDISTMYVNPNCDFKFFESNKIDFNFRFGAFVAWTISSLDSVTISDAKQSIKDYISDRKNWWFQFQQSINLHPGGNKQSSIFIRASQYLELSSKNNYFTFQIGYSTTLSNLLKF
jgi:hypothetical protein